MAKKTSRSTGRDRSRVSAQPHEISYAAKKLGTKKRGVATKAVKAAKKSLGRKTSRAKVMKKARSVA